MSVDVAAELCPRRSLRRSSLEQKQSSVETTKSVNGKKRSMDDEDAPVLDNSFSPKDEELEDEEEEDSGGPPPLKKVARAPATGGRTIMWKTATGAPKQLAFKKVGSTPVNGSSSKPQATATVSAAPTNLATALAGLLPQPTYSSGPSLYTNNQKRVVIRQPAPVPRITNATPLVSTSHITRRTDKVNNEVCKDCVKALPTLRRSLGRLEARMEAVTSMIKQIVTKHSQQNVSFTRAPTSLLPRTQPAIASPSSSPLNGNRVAGNPTAMRFVPITGRNAVNPGSSVMRKFVNDKIDRLSPSSLMYRMISRGLLTYRSPTFTVEEYYKQAPNVIKAHTLKQVQQVMEDLFNARLYKKCDPSVSAMDEECIFEKEKDLSKLARLSDYGVNTADFLSGCFDD